LGSLRDQDVEDLNCCAFNGLTQTCHKHWLCMWLI